MPLSFVRASLAGFVSRGALPSGEYAYVMVTKDGRVLAIKPTPSLAARLTFEPQRLTLTGALRFVGKDGAYFDCTIG